MRNDELPPGRLPLDDALRALGGPEEPPAGLEARVVARLTDGHTLHPAGDAQGAVAVDRLGSRWLRVAVAAAAAIVVFAAGMLVGSQTPAPPEGPRYALLILPAPDFTPPRPEEETAVVERYRAWASGLAGQGRFVLGEKLGATVAVVSPTGSLATDAAPSVNDLLGLFIITAGSDDDAVATARDHPHVHAGGRVAIVRIEPT